MSNLNVAINAQLLSLDQSFRSAGISWYIYNLLRHLPLVESSYCYSAFLNERNFPTTSGLSLRYSALPTQKPEWRFLWEQIAQPLHLVHEKSSLLHSPSFLAPLYCPCPSIITVHDLAFKHFPSILPRKTRIILDQMIKVSIRQARKIITVSDCTKQDIMHFYNVAPEKIQTIYHGVDPEFYARETDEIDAFRRTNNLPSSFIFRLGTLEPRKNIEGLIRAYGIYYAQSKDLPPLYIGGGKGWYYETILTLVTQLKLEDKIIFAGYIPQNELPLWYNAATVFVFPSLYEGFGLPILESMACGTPVITSNVSSMPEIAGEAAMLVDPNDDESLAEAIKLVIEDSKRQKRIRRLGQRHAAQFSWKMTAKKTVEAYEAALEA